MANARRSDTRGRRPQWHDGWRPALPLIAPAMAKRAVGVGEGRDTDDGVQPEKGDRRGGVVEIDPTRRKPSLQAIGQRVHINLEADRERVPLT